MTSSTATEPLQIAVHQIGEHVGRVLGRSEWRVVEQAEADSFAAATHDQQWIHTDPLRAAQGPFGATIAHGYLTLALATSFVAEVLEVPDAAMIVNYGVDRVRFPAPLPLGAEVRAEVTVTGVLDCVGGVQVGLRLVYEVAGQAKPCCVADVLVRYYTTASVVTSVVTR